MAKLSVCVSQPSPGAVDAAERDFDERHVAFYQPSGQQAALAEAIAPVGVADLVGFFREIEGFARGAAHQPHGPLVSNAVPDGRSHGVLADEAVVERAEQAQPGVDGGLVDRLGRFEIGDLQIIGLLAFAAARQAVADQQGIVLRTQKAGTIGAGAEGAVGSDADEVRQFRVRTAELFGHQRTERRIADRPLRQIAVAHQVRGAAMVPFLGAQGTEHGQMLALLGQQRQMFGDFQPRRRRLDLFELSAVGMAGL